MKTNVEKLYGLIQDLVDGLEENAFILVTVLERMKKLKENESIGFDLGEKKNFELKRNSDFNS